MDEAQAQQEILVASLERLLRAQGKHVQRFDTHISHVLVTDNETYKLKKPVRFPFLDFTELAARRFFCEEELRLNRRLAPDLYLGVANITGAIHAPRLDGPGTPIDYAVRMRTFSQECLWSNRLRSGVLGVAEIDALAACLADFHAAAPAAPAHGDWGSARAIAAAAEESFADLAALGGPDGALVAALHAWDAARRTALQPVFAARLQAGRVRECHGDLHCANILTEPDGVRVFDGIEFNAALRWIDVMNDIAFVCMDLAHAQRPDLAARLLNQYLERSGDHAGLAVFRYYACARALVRAKVALLRAGQADAALEADACLTQCRSYLALAERYTQAPQPALILTRGVAGCGKTTLARQLVESLDAVQLRSDVERKRLAGVAATDRSGARPDAPLYSAAASEQTYARLLELADGALQAGFAVIVDAAFLRVAQRAPFLALAQARGVPLLILDVSAADEILRARVTAREAAGRDASDAGLAVLDRQRQQAEPLGAAEARCALPVDTTHGTPAELAGTVRDRLSAQARAQ